MHVKRTISLSLICIMGLIFSCSNEVDRDAIIGEYEANYYEAVDTLEIRPDGTYVHRYRPQGSEEVVTVNKWALEEWEGKPYITFEGWNSSEPLQSVRRKSAGEDIGIEFGTRPGRWPACVERSVFGKPRLCIDRDLCYFYLKK